MTNQSCNKVLFGQDIQRPIHPGLRSDTDKYQASLKKVLSLEADWLLEGHLGVYKGKKAVEGFIRAYLA